MIALALYSVAAGCALGACGIFWHRYLRKPQPLGHRCPSCSSTRFQEYHNEPEEVLFTCHRCGREFDPHNPHAMDSALLAAEHEVRWLCRVDDDQLLREFTALRATIESRAWADEYERQLSLRPTCKHPRTRVTRPHWVGTDHGLVCQDCGESLLIEVPEPPAGFEELLVEVTEIGRAERQFFDPHGDSHTDNHSTTREYLWS